MGYETDELSLQEIHDATLALLIKVKAICEEIGIKYFLAYGTLLGAVRHKNFIPWDDDVDLWMLRKDYNKFFEYLDAHKDTLYPISYCSRRNTQNYLYAINRITDMRYKYVDIRTHATVDYGIFIDVYPIDAVGNTQKDFLKMYRKIEMLNSMYYIYMQSQYSSIDSNKLKAILKRILCYFLKLRFKNQNDILDYIEHKTNAILASHNFENSKLVGVAIWWAYMQCYNKQLFDKKTDIELSNEKFSAPAKYDELLHLIYGDYMTLPPQEKRVPYHGYKIYRRDTALWNFI